MTPEGARNIEDIAAGEWVVAIHCDGVSDSGKAFTKIADLVRGTASHFVRIQLDGEQLRCTPRHRFMVFDRGWTRAENLTVDDMLLTARGELVPVRSLKIEQMDTPVQVYNFILEKYTLTTSVSRKSWCIMARCSLGSFFRGWRIADRRVGSHDVERSEWT